MLENTHLEELALGIKSGDTFCVFKSRIILYLRD